MTATETYQVWRHHLELPADLRAELIEIDGNQDEIEERFYRDLAFGTGGLRGILGAGTNRMNIITVRRATRGIADFLLAGGTEAAQKGVVVGYDCRRMSREFAVEVGCVLAAAGIRSYVFSHLCPTPELSFAVRHLNAAAGVMITASHNPPEYNGYKVYGPDGGQILTATANQIVNHIAAIDDPFAIPVLSEDDAVRAGKLTYIADEIDTVYEQTVMARIQVPGVTASQRSQLNIVYTPLHGTGNLPVMHVLQQSGYTSTQVVPSQEQPDGEFSTVKSPNPEEPEALSIAIEQAKQSGADLVMGTDPDADRVGVAVRDRAGEFQLLTGNQVGGLLVDFVLARLQEENRIPDNGIVFKTIVTSDLGAKAAEQYGVQVENTLTGFKYIGERITTYERTGEYTFVFGYEESYGYLAQPIVRDKDAVQICLLIAEMAAYYKAQGETLLDALDDLFARVGYYREALISRTLPGQDGVAKIQQVMKGLRSEGLPVEGRTIAYVEDYLHGTRTYLADVDGHHMGDHEALILPKEDVLKYVFTDGAWLAIRPSGTEPKIKVYIGARGTDDAKCRETLEKLRELAGELV